MSELRATLEGFAAGPAELGKTKAGHDACSFSVAVQPRKQNDAGEWEDDGPTQWVRVQAYEDLAVEMSERIRKGTRVEVVGRVNVRSYLHKDGTTRIGITLVARGYHVLSRDFERDDVSDLAASGAAKLTGQAAPAGVPF